MQAYDGASIGANKTRAVKVKHFAEAREVSSRYVGDVALDMELSDKNHYDKAPVRVIWYGF